MRDWIPYLEGTEPRFTAPSAAVREIAPHVFGNCRSGKIGIEYYCKRTDYPTCKMHGVTMGRLVQLCRIITLLTEYSGLHEPAWPPFMGHLLP
jgi:hypothetical protein